MHIVSVCDMTIQASGTMSPLEKYDERIPRKIGNCREAFATLGSNLPRQVELVKILLPDYLATLLGIRRRHGGKKYNCN